MEIEIESFITSKSEKTQHRINFVKESIKAHRKNIKLLQSKIKTPQPIKTGELYAPRIIQYYSLPKCIKRYYFTVKNLTDQINELNKELAVLLEYGA